MFSNIHSQTDNLVFVGGEKVIFEDLSVKQSGATLSKWSTLEGRAIVDQNNDSSMISIKEYYTKLVPVFTKGTKLTDQFTIEYDCWLDKGYDGNPGVELNLNAGDDWVTITPNKHDMVVFYPKDGRATTQNSPEMYGEEKFYDKWVHISISYNKKRLLVYQNGLLMIDVADVRMVPNRIMVTGNTSGDMPIWFKNFRITTVLPKQVVFENNKFVTHSIQFDVNKATIKPESMSVIAELKTYLDANPSIKLEIGGHTDSDGETDANMKLSQLRAEAVKTQLISMGIDGNRLISKGFGEGSPISANTTTEGKANNRRVEFTIIKNQ